MSPRSRSTGSGGTRMSGALIRRRGAGVSGDLEVAPLVHHCVAAPARAEYVVE